MIIMMIMMIMMEGERGRGKKGEREGKITVERVRNGWLKEWGVGIS